MLTTAGNVRQPRFSRFYQWARCYAERNEGTTLPKLNLFATALASPTGSLVKRSRTEDQQFISYLVFLVEQNSHFASKTCKNQLQKVAKTTQFITTHRAVEWPYSSTEKVCRSQFWAQTNFLKVFGTEKKEQRLKIREFFQN